MKNTMNIHILKKIINPRDSIRQCALAVAAMATLALAPAAHAAINIDQSGSGVNNFSATPAVTEWSTMTWTGAPGDVTDAATMDTAVGLLAASSFTTALPTSATTANPGPSANVAARRNTSWHLLQMRPAGTSKGCVLMATLKNISGSPITKLGIACNVSRFDNSSAGGGEEVSGLRAYYSMTGAAGSWTAINDLCVSPIGGNTDNVAPPTTALSATVTLSSPLAWNGTMYVLWADDDNNINGVADDANMIDDVDFTINEYTPSANLMTFTWSGYTELINQTAKTVDLYVVHTTELTTINPTCTVSAGASVLPASEANAGFTAANKTVTYTVTPSAGDPVDYSVTVHPVLAAPGQILPVPADLNPGDPYRLVFVTSTETYSGGSNHGSNPPWFTTVADYDAFATTTANAVPALAALSTPWKAIITTESPYSNAKDNTGTNPSSSTGVPIYNLSGRRVADHNADLWDGTIQNPINVNELGGGPVLQRGNVYRVWTGGVSPNGFNLITQSGGWIINGSADSTTGWIANGNYDNDIHGDLQPIYAISGLLTVPLPGTDLITFIWGSHLGVIDQGLKTVSLTVPYGTDLTTINPTCTVSSGATVLPASGANAGFTESTKTVTYTVTSGGSHTDYAATVTVEPASSACDMLTFKAGSYSGGISSTNVTLMVPLGTNVTALSPTYTVSPGATEDVSYPSGSTRDFTTPQDYTITAQDGTTTQTYTVSVLNAPITVPRGLNPGDKYRLVFVTSTKTYSGGSNHGTNPPWFTSVADYDAFATSAATAAPELSAIGATTWKAIISTTTPNSNARTNTATDPVANAATSVPIYNLAGVRIANGYSDLWDATIQNPINITELGGVPPASTYDGKLRVWTGAWLDGGNGGAGNALITQDGGWIQNGLASSTDGSWVSGNYENAIHGLPQPIYAISGILEVPVGGSPACNLVSFNYGTAVGVITPGTPNAVSLTVPYSAPPLTALTPAVTISAFATFSPTGAQDFSNSQAVPVEYIVTAESGAIQTYQVTVTKAAASTACDMVSFTAAGVSGVITPGSPNTVLVTLPPGTPVSALTPTVVVSPLAGYAPTGPQDFTGSVATPVPYTVTAEDGTQKVYQVTVAVAGPPPNDNFANAIALPGTGGIQTGTGNRYATLEPGEPGINGATHTVWFKWTAPSNGSYTISTVGSTRVGGGEWDAMLGIHTGTAVNALTALTGLPDGNPQDTGVEETMTLPVTGGTTYHIQAAGYLNEEASNIKLTFTFVGTGTSYGTWETANGASGGASADSNNNGVPNGVEFFMGGTQASPATLPALVDTAGTWTWTIPYDPAALATYLFQVSGDLAGWTDVLPGDPKIEVLTGPPALRLTLSSGMRFCRLVVATP
ncbi:MAG: hypothetical protein NTW21_06865 [Verrucomicrobia bacterium]|nr:hypothetical protein [Verrucomicrobiota bacterium]